MNAERIERDGIIHQSGGRWYVTVPSRKNVNAEEYKICGNGVVRESDSHQPRTWPSREEAMRFLHSIT